MTKILDPHIFLNYWILFSCMKKNARHWTNRNYRYKINSKAILNWQKKLQLRGTNLSIQTAFSAASDKHIANTHATISGLKPWIPSAVPSLRILYYCFNLLQQQHTLLKECELIRRHLAQTTWHTLVCSSVDSAIEVSWRYSVFVHAAFPLTLFSAQK